MLIKNGDIYILLQNLPKVNKNLSTKFDKYLINVLLSSIVVIKKFYFLCFLFYNKNSS